MLFYLGTHQPHWLRRPDFVGVPLFVSARRLRDQRTWKPASTRWALDSGGFTELNLYGRWETTAATYADDARRWRDQIGGLDWAAPRDWMCEPPVVAKTGLSVREHQQRTTADYLDLTTRAVDVPWVPVLQGWHPDDYRRHVEDYAAAGVRLADLPTVGLGSVCRRQGTEEIAGLVRDLAATGVRLHGFGFKLTGVTRVGRLLASSDSLAWSYSARRSPPMAGHTHKNCANCPAYALVWRSRVQSLVGPGSVGDETATGNH